MCKSRLGGPDEVKHLNTCFYPSACYAVHDQPELPVQVVLVGRLDRTGGRWGENRDPRFLMPRTVSSRVCWHRRTFVINAYLVLCSSVALPAHLDDSRSEDVVGQKMDGDV